MKLNARCIACQVNRYELRLRPIIDEQLKMQHLNHIFQLILNSHPDDTLAYLNMQIDAYLEPIVPNLKDYKTIKQTYNQMMLALNPWFNQQLSTQKDELYASLQLARAGNYIDFGAMDSLSQDKLMELLNNAFEDKLDEKVYDSFVKELQQAQTLIYCLDNCGEIVVDMIAIKTIIKQFPHLKVIAMVRGGDVLNDVTIADVQQVGLDQICEIMTNTYPMAGIDLNHIDPNTYELLQHADVILAKGQGNFESLCGCGLNIYYLLLCKCSLFAERFAMPLYQGVFHKER